MSEFSYRAPTYPIIQFLVKYGKVCALVIGLAVFGLGLLGASGGLGPFAALAGLAAGVVVGGLLASYAEVLAILSDALIPK